MAATLVVPETTRTNEVVSITGTEFEISTPVRVSVSPGGFVATVTSDEAGDFDASAVLEWKPEFPRKYRVRADDGTNQLSATIQVFATT